MIVTETASSIFGIVDFDEATPEVQAIYNDTKKSLGLPFVLNWFKCQGNNPVLLKGNWSKLKSTLVEGIVPNVIKQLIIYNVSAERNCDYCAQAHRIFANLTGKFLSEDASFNVADDMENDLVPQSYKVAVSVVTKAALESGTNSEEYIYKLREAGFLDVEIQELLAQADLVNMLNTIANISGIRLDAELTDMAI